MLDTKSYFRTRGRTTRIVEVNSLDNSQTWGTFEVYKDSDTAAHTAIFTFNPSNNNKSSILSVHINGSEIWAQCPASKRQNSIVTSEYVGSNYVRFGNGLQICWGVGGAGTVNLPAPFANTNYQVTTSQVGGGHTYNCGTENYTTTSFNITSYQSHWVAIGYWY